ncbi:exocyst complex component 8-like isoform X2 [Lytechinus variegatus]|uniref:exocyst complex component 8-like isoform X2 n=1 Tax=Lytechinus variegatus TaxID=7654 RepID=UPI001BB220F9|nr:exocyst complex component 8-like isoform X2 [Lytechinus variegatus]
MAEQIVNKLSKDNFNADEYVLEIASGGDVYQDLQEHKQRVQNLNDDTAVALKKNVYRNYTQFIETAKEISYLEGEMYQLSHILTEQKTIMTQLLDMSMGGKEETGRDKNAPQAPEEHKRTIASLLDRVEGCSRIAEVPGRYIIYDADLIELDTDSFQEIQRVHAYLLNDSLVITTFIRNRRGPVRYKYQALFELDSLAVVNVRDVGPVKNAFKVLRFPDQHMYSTETAKSKRTWLDKLEEAKKIQVAANSQRRELAEQMSIDIPEGKNQEAFEEEENLFLQSVSMETSMLQVDWLLELPEDLDMSIAQRNFEESVDLILRANEYLEQVPVGPSLKEMRARVDHRVKQLTDTLTRELQVSPDRSLRGGPQVTRRAVVQLIRLGKSTQACDLFLKNRSAAIKQSLRQLRIEGATSLYVTKLCHVFFNHIIETGKEFRFTFSQNQGCYSAFVVWAKAELRSFVNLFSRQALAKQTALVTVAECVCIARTSCSLLSTIGLDLLFALNGLTLKGIREVLLFNKEQFIEASRHRNVEERWYPLNLKNPNAANNLVRDMQQLGFDKFNQLVYDSCFVNLANSTVAFTKVVLAFLKDALKLYVPELYPNIVEVLVDVFDNHIQLVEGAVTSDRFEEERQFILKNVDYLFKTLLPLIEKKLTDVAGRKVKELQDIQKRNQVISSRVRTLGVLI